MHCVLLCSVIECILNQIMTIDKIKCYEYLNKFVNDGVMWTKRSMHVYKQCNYVLDTFPTFQISVTDAHWQSIWFQLSFINVESKFT